MAYIHEQKIMHDDLKMRNIIVRKLESDSSYEVRIIDYERSFKPESELPAYPQTHGIYGSIVPTAPEQFGKEWLQYKTDNGPFLAETFSAGQVIHSWLSGTTNLPWVDKIMKSYNKKLRPSECTINQVTESIDSYLIKQRKKYENDPLQLTILKMLEPDPTKRLTLTQALDAFKKLGC